MYSSHCYWQAQKYSLAAEIRTPYIMELRPSAEFSYEAGKAKLANLRLRSDRERLGSIVTPGDNNNTHDEFENQYESGSSGRYEQLLRLSGRVDLDSRLTIGCCGAALAYLGRRKTVEFLPGDTAADLAYRVSSIEMFSLNNTM